ncbi:MAG: hypothetical protein INR71_01840 [Terriglobus roseus]|nr:hypothetical protein [Terriglobus roseus]
MVAATQVAMPGTARADDSAPKYAQNGWYQRAADLPSGTAMDGWRANITVTTDTPGANSCTLNSVLANNNVSSATLQLESGDVICGANTSIDGSCSLNTNLVRFDETDDHNTYTCYQYGTATKGSTDTYRVTREPTFGSALTYYRAYINGTGHQDIELSDDPNDPNIVGMAWAELTPGSGCNSNPKNYAIYDSINRYNYSANTFSPVYNAEHFNPGECFTLSAVSNQTFHDELNTN